MSNLVTDNRTRNKKSKVIAAYKGDTFLIVGNIREVAEYLGVTVDTVHYYCSPTYHERKKNDTKI